MRAPEGARGQGQYVDGPRRNFAGGAGLLSTARDYARFLEHDMDAVVLANFFHEHAPFAIRASTQISSGVS